MKESKEEGREQSFVQCSRRYIHPPPEKGKLAGRVGKYLPSRPRMSAHMVKRNSPGCGQSLGDREGLPEERHRIDRKDREGETEGCLRHLCRQGEEPRPVL